MRPIGMIGGMCWESTAVYYRLINSLARERRGGFYSAEILLHSLDFGPIADLEARGDWATAGQTLADAALGLERAGADCIVLCTNTMHKVADQITRATRVPFLHIADVAAAELRRQGLRRPLLLGTSYTMEQGFCRDRLAAQADTAVVIPDRADGREVHRIIADELCRGLVLDASREILRPIMARAVAQGCDSVVLGCTEIGMLVRPGDADVPILDTTHLHAAAAVDYALAETIPDDNRQSVACPMPAALPRLKGVI
jgi:aspartate racemase